MNARATLPSLRHGSMLVGAGHVVAHDSVDVRREFLRDARMVHRLHATVALVIAGLLFSFAQIPVTVAALVGAAAVLAASLLMSLRGRRVDPTGARPSTEVTSATLIASVLIVVGVNLGLHGAAGAFGTGCFALSALGFALSDVVFSTTRSPLLAFVVLIVLGASAALFGESAVQMVSEAASPMLTPLVVISDVGAAAVTMALSVSLAFRVVGETIAPERLPLGAHRQAAILLAVAPLILAFQVLANQFLANQTHASDVDAFSGGDFS